MQRSERISVFCYFLNLFLFLIKIAAGFFANSLAVISDAFNSFSDVLSSIIIYFAVKAANKKPDHDHPFGHSRAEPIAGLVIAIFSGILGFEIIKTAVRNIIFGHNQAIKAQPESKTPPLFRINTGHFHNSRMNNAGAADLHPAHSLA